MDKKTYVIEEFAKAGLSLSESKAQQFVKYAELLVERNKYVNLTAITDFEEIVKKHFLDSVLLLSDNVSRETLFGCGNDGEKKPLTGVEMECPEKKLWPDDSKASAAPSDVSRETSDLELVDVGTGAGFPGLPLKIFCPWIRLTLIDSLDKRIKFLNEVVNGLGLTGVTCIHARAEDAARRPELRDGFDMCVSRAVAAMPVLSEYCLPFVKVGGRLIAYKSSGCNEEVLSAMGAFRQLGAELEDKTSLTLPDTDIVRSFIVIKKKTVTAEKFPRKAGKPEKSPLK